MIKNVIIGVLALLSLFLFLFALTQQIKAQQLSELLLKSEREALQQKETLETALDELRRQTEVTRLELQRADQPH
jgi:hypothetical protein